MTTRRHLLSATGAGLLALHSASAKRVSKMRFGLMTYQWGIDWDIPTLIANCTKTKAFGVELRTSANYAHGVEITLADAQRFDSPDPARLAKAIEVTIAHIKLSQDIGGKGVRVVPNDYHSDIPKEKT